MARTLIKTKTAGWFIEPGSDKKVRKQDGDVILTEAEFAAKAIKAEDKDKAEPVVLSTGKIAHGPTITIKCADCRTERVIMKQDAFQAKRCIDCQREHRNELRRQKRAAAKKGK